MEFLKLLGGTMVRRGSQLAHRSGSELQSLGALEVSVNSKSYLTSAVECVDAVVFGSGTAEVVQRQRLCLWCVHRGAEMLLSISFPLLGPKSPVSGSCKWAIVKAIGDILWSAELPLPWFGEQNTTYTRNVKDFLVECIFLGRTMSAQEH
ncbi:hypothetical protein DY000_02016184 [Brassica cretica]|uniref:Uncharacterized protein n=1 Tax=Brassica cretica TaxID=69181 RepID=A0ABQ7DDF5_BRACR|nr:hypothetical protein DY000_02016184 [Brassica cretica]